jgi:murein DD-endopeptidase MepM/ murein hydrolase activator NlpD
MARRLPVVLAAAAAILPSGAAMAATAGPVLFPVVGGATYTDDYGQPRAGHAHEGNDLLAPKFRPVVAVEDGIAEPYPTASSGCLLYLTSKTHEYLYVHLNNDSSTRQNVGCSEAYAPGVAGRHKVRVRAGQILGYVGNSGDAEGGPTHLHFEIHTVAGRPSDPYPIVHVLPVPLFGVPLAPTRASRKAVATFALHLVGTYESARSVADGTRRIALDLSAATVTRPDGSVVAVRSTRRVVLLVPATLAAQTLTFRAGRPLALDTVPGTPTIARQTTQPGSWMVARFTP